MIELESNNFVPPGSVACNTALITDANGNVTTDLLAADNNYYTFCDSVRASFDPNAKYVQPSGGYFAYSQYISFVLE